MLHLHLLLLLAASTCSLGVRVELTNDMLTEAEKPKAKKKTLKTFKCVVKTQGTWKLALSFPIKATTQSQAIFQCRLFVTHKGEDVFLPDGQFPHVFQPTYDPDDIDVNGRSRHGSCVCKVNGQPRTKFRLMSQESREQCENGSFESKEQCWASYKRMTRMKIEREGEVVTWVMGNGGIRSFVVDKKCPECEGEACRSVKIPSYTSTLTAEDMKALFTTLTSKRATGNDRIEDVLPEEELENLRFTKYDANSNGKLNMVELRNMYNSDGHSVSETELEEAVNEFDFEQNDTIEIRFDQFEKFQAVLRGIKDKKQKAEEDSAGGLNHSRRAAQVQPKPSPVNTDADATNRADATAKSKRAKSPVPKTPKVPPPKQQKLTVAQLRNTRCCCAEVGGQVHAARVAIEFAVGATGWFHNGTKLSQACPTLSSLKPFFQPETAASMCACTTENLVWKSSTKCGGLRGTIDSGRDTVETHHHDLESEDQFHVQCRDACVKSTTPVVRQECLDEA